MSISRHLKQVARPTSVCSRCFKKINYVNILTQNDIDERVQLVKKECGDTRITLTAIPLDQTHLPTTITTSGSFPN